MTSKPRSKPKAASMAGRIRNLLLRHRRPLRIRDMAAELTIPPEKYASFTGAVAQLYARGQLFRIERGAYTITKHGKRVVASEVPDPSAEVC